MEQEQLNQLVNSLIQFAQQQLEKVGEFYPFGASIKTDGNLTLEAVHTGSEYPDSNELIQMTESVFKANALAGNIVAAGLCMDVRIQIPGNLEKSDAIQVKLEHKEGDSRNAFLPYSKNSSGGIEYGDFFIEPKQQEYLI